MEAHPVPARRDGRIIIHFDYDCFYAAVFEARDPGLKGLPLAVQQKQIIVTCNYEARRRGLYKLQLIRDAKRVCPDVIIELGEDLTRFRDASKELYNYIRGFSWSQKVERLGFDEVWMDVSDMIDFNVETLNRRDLEHSFFQISRDDPTQGFAFDASTSAGHVYPKIYKFDSPDGRLDDLALRLRLASHLALYLRHQLEQERGYTSTVGISTSKLLSKLVGNLNKPKGQTTLMPPLSDDYGQEGNVTAFMKGHEIGKVPGIGFKLAQKLREFVLQRPADFDAGLVYGETKEKVTVGDVRNVPDLNPEKIEKLLAGPGSPHGIGYKMWCLLHGIDDAEVDTARAVPKQISIEDSYVRLDTMPEILAELTTLARSLLNRMRIDLLGDEDQPYEENRDDLDTDRANHNESPMPRQKWLAHPKTLRLTTRPRQPLQPDGTRARSFKRISHSGPLPNFVFSLHEGIDALAERLVKEALVSMFRKLHPEKAGWNLSLVNLAVTNMAEAASESKTAAGRDIGNMFRRQEDVLKDFRVVDSGSDLDPEPPSGEPIVQDPRTDKVDQHMNIESLANMHEDAGSAVESSDDTGWDDGETDDERKEFCGFCGVQMPTFAMIAHRRFHSQATEQDAD